MLVGALGATGAFALTAFTVSLGLLGPFDRGALPSLQTFDSECSTSFEAPTIAEGESGLRLREAADTRVALYRIAFEMVRDRPIPVRQPPLLPKRPSHSSRR
jgi:hypothetical protein